MEPNDRSSKEWYEWYLREKGKFNPETLRIAVKNGLSITLIQEYLDILKGEQRTFKKRKKQVKEIFVSADL